MHRLKLAANVSSLAFVAEFEIMNYYLFNFSKAYDIFNTHEPFN
jgi:hypothetical protein